MARKYRPITVEGDAAYVPLTRGYTAVIDVEDISRIDDRSWQASIGYYKSDGSVGQVYAVRRPKSERKEVIMHRLLIDCPDGLYVDHIDGNGLNNRKSNLRIATNAQNQHNQRKSIRNTSGFKGVSWSKKSQKWQAHIKVNNRLIGLGCFVDICDAADAYAKASARFHGAFGRVE